MCYVCMNYAAVCKGYEAENEPQYNAWQVDVTDVPLGFPETDRIAFVRFHVNTCYHEKAEWHDTWQIRDYHAHVVHMFNGGWWW